MKYTYVLEKRNYIRKLILYFNTFKAENMREEDLEGIREHTTRQITSLEEKIVALQLDTQRQDEIIENKLKSVGNYQFSWGE